MHKVISLFSGCGGSDFGLLGGFSYLGKKYKKLPYQILHASDIDKYCVETYNANFKHPAAIKDIYKLTLKEFADQEIDVLMGGFPCQSFSTVNPNKDPFDARGNLYKEMARLIKEVNPKVIVGENVKGLLVLHKGKILQRVIQEFESLGYKVYYKLLNSADYGVPQKRQRLFLIGVRNDLSDNYEFPSEIFYQDKNPRWVPLGSVVKKLEPDDPKFYFSEKAVRGMKNAKNNMKRGLAQNLNEPCLTITSHLAKVSLNSRDPVLLVDPKKELYRRFTPREAASIQSFSEEFIFPVSDTQAYKQIGNAIPPVLMWHIANSILPILKR